MSEEEIATSFDEFGLSAPLEEVSLFVIAAPRQIATLTPHHETERKERILLKQRTMETFAKWRQKRAGKSSGNDRVLLLTFQDAENPIHYNEAEDYRQALTSILSTQTEANPPKVEEISGPVGESPDAYLKRVFQRIASQQEKGDKPASSGMGNISPQKPSFTDPASVISPLLESWTQNPADSSVKAVFTVDPAKAPFLLNHQLKGKAILPLVVIMEAMAETPLRFDTRPIELRNIKSVRGMICSEPVPYRLACLGTEKEEGWSLRLVGDYYNAQGKKINDRIPYASGEVRRIGATWGDGIPVCPDDQGTVTTWTPVYPGPNPEGFYHGPILQKLQFCRFLKDGRLLGEILVPDRNELFGRNVGTPILDAAVLDAAFWACGVLNGANHPGTSVVPDSLLSLKGIPNRLRSGETARVVTTLRETLTLPLGFRQALFDFVIYNEEKEPVWKVEGFKMTILEGASS